MKSKYCWFATEVEGGWRLKLAWGAKDYPVTGVVFKTVEEVEMVCHSPKGKVVFVHLKNSKFKE